MTTETVSLFLALLAVVAEVIVVAGVALVVGGRLSPAARKWGNDVLDSVQPHATALALAIATTATLGSLYFSEVAHFPPCRLCWVQRGFMYPLVPVLGFALLRRSRRAVTVGMVLATLGGVVSTYHVLLEHFPSIEGGTCDPTNPCTLIWVKELGYLTIPAMALSGFAAILTLLGVARRSPHPTTAGSTG